MPDSAERFPGNVTVNLQYRCVAGIDTSDLKIRYASSVWFRSMPNILKTNTERLFVGTPKTRNIEARAKQLMRGILDDDQPFAVRLQVEDENWNELFLLVRPPVLSLLRYVFGIVNAEDQDDMFQTVMLRFYRYHRSYNVSHPLLPWLYAIARNVKREWMEKSGLRFESAPIAPQESDNLVTKLTAEAVLAKLPEDDRHILWLSYNEELKDAEISEHLNIPLSTAKFYLRRAKKRAREVLTAYSRRGEEHEA
jgi:RNA polymerase sigma-70 factor (ECF subfamily)